MPLIPINDIIVDRENRQRRNLHETDIDALALSISEVGLINPITVRNSADGIYLIAGERRLTACKQLDMTEVEVRFFDDLDKVQQHVIELEENIQRKDLTWQDHNQAITDYHALRTSMDEDWTIAKTADALRVTHSLISKHNTIREAINEGVEEVAESPKMSSAFNYAQRRKERKAAIAKRMILSDEAPKVTVDPEDFSVDMPEVSVPLPANVDIKAIPEEALTRHIEIQQVDFIEWSGNYTGEPFDFIHVDFPYDANVGSGGGSQTGNASFGKYEDTAEIYENLCNAFEANLSKFCSTEAHIMFWFHPKHYQITYDFLHGAGLFVEEVPLVWYKSDNQGIIPDANRRPRRVYETAFMCSRGDRKVVRPTFNCCPAPTPPKGEKVHPAQKSKLMLDTFFRMFVDDTTRVLDPTCGSGEALAVAERLGATYILGIEFDEKFAIDAKERLGIK